MGRVKHDFQSEHDLCNYFAEQARLFGWEVYPETSGYDLLLVAKDVRAYNVKPGDQIGVEAKLLPNVQVLSQAMPKRWGHTGPDFHAVLVPSCDRSFLCVAQACRVMVFAAGRKHYTHYERNSRMLHKVQDTYRQYYEEKCWHPGVSIAVPAGVKSPKSVTPWKVHSVKLCLLALRQGFLTSADFREEGVSQSLWRQKGWIEPTGKKGRTVLYKIVEEKRPPHVLWPEIAKALEDV